MRQAFSRRPKAATAASNLFTTQNTPPVITLTTPLSIVFIHGLTGHREKTWTAHGASEPWPKVLLPSELPNARVLLFGYDANVVDWRGLVSQSRIGDHAWNLLTSLAAHREKDETNERPIIFVCHSLGALALTTARQRVEKHLQNTVQPTVGIASLGTPHHGAGLARWAELLSRHIGIVKQTNTKIVSVLRQDSEVLARIQEGFHTMIGARSEEAQAQIHIACFFEELPLPGVGGAAAFLPGPIPIGIHSNHMDMVRFSSADDPGFTAVCGELRRWMLQIGAAEDGHQNRSAPNHTQLPGNGRNGQPNSTPRFIVPYTNNPDFVGRSEILRQLKSKLCHDQDSPDGNRSRERLFYGLGGIGKTQIALAYVFWLHQTHRDISVFWIHASNVERFRQGYALIAQECQIPGYDDPKTDVLPLVKKWLERKDGSQWLMVIDNADDMQIFFGKQTEPVDNSLSGHMGTVGRYIPDCSHGAILVTTRNLQASSRLIKGKQPIKVGELNDEETVELLRTRLDGIDATPGDLSALSSRLEHLPLALVQGAAFIQENDLTIDQYFRLLDNSDQHLVDLLSEEFKTEGRDSETPRAVAETWILSFEQIQRQNALAGKLLSLMSEMELTKAVGVLKAFCFIVGDEGRGFDIRRLVQLVTQKWLGRKGMMRSFATKALLVVSQAYPYGNAYLPHATAVLSLDDSGTNEQSVARASLLYCVAGFFYYKGQWKDAGNLFQQATDIQRGVLGEEHPETLSSIADLAAAYWNQGRWKEAENLEVQVMETRKRVLGEEHPDTLSSIRALALTYQRQGRWKEAEDLGVQVTEVRKRVLGEEHPDTLTSMANLALTYCGQGRLKEAGSLQLQVIETRKRVLGEEHPETLDEMANLALTYHSQGRRKEAKELEAQVKETRKRVLGGERLDTLLANTSSLIPSGVKGVSKALELMLNLLHLRKRVLGPDSPIL
ncbi:hypothetical protein C7999DRAFT_42748 [Corynascus novoguineensis]|uniref:AB hydrolase-1 domain-containing protein n=1 Tax=Corynascus novoguineensis TaxID=1126955 RepID=A0AAN7CQ19_9PEZI|nr:hypothetical protein C7999DRAFT_42748 [Corynascus novoguineensis]